MKEMSDEELIAYLVKLTNEMRDFSTWEDANRYAAETVAFHSARQEILRRMSHARV